MSPVQLRPVQLRPAQASSVQLRPVQLRPVQLRPVHAAPAQSTEHRHVPVQSAPFHVPPFQVVPAAVAGAQTAGFPAKPIRILVGFAAGGGNDVAARLVAQQLSGGALGTVLVDNRTGASGLIAADMLAKSAPDGTTLMVASQTIVAVAPVLYKSVPFEAQRRCRARRFLEIAAHALAAVHEISGSCTRSHAPESVLSGSTRYAHPRPPRSWQSRTDPSGARFPGRCRCFGRARLREDQ